MQLLAGVDSGWATGIGTVVAALAAVGGILFQQRRQHRQDLAAVAKEEEEAPGKELVATSQAAEAIARAAASLIAPFQLTIAGQSHELGALREAVAVSRTAEEKCQQDLAKVKEELHACCLKLREVTDHLGLEPSGE